MRHLTILSQIQEESWKKKGLSVLVPKADEVLKRDSFYQNRCGCFRFETKRKKIRPLECVENNKWKQLAKRWNLRGIRKFLLMTYTSKKWGPKWGPWSWCWGLGLRTGKPIIKLKYTKKLKILISIFIHFLIDLMYKTDFFFNVVIKGENKFINGHLVLSNAGAQIQDLPGRALGVYSSA